MIEVDGSFGEGGGQILRTALALAAVLGRETRIFNIRAGRSEPGLRAQHLTGVKAVAEICSASMRGLEIGSSEFTFKPGKPRAGRFRFDVGTAGSITLVLQTLMPLLAFLSREVDLEVVGGTDVKWSPPIDYVRFVTLALLEKIGYHGNLRVDRRGHYPRGGGLVKFHAMPSPSLLSITGREIGEVSRIIGVSHSVRLPRHVAERQAASARNLITRSGLPDPQVDLDVSEDGMDLGAGSGIVLCAITSAGGFLGADSLGERGRPAEEVGLSAGKRLVEEVESGMFLDRQMGDMIVPYIALAEGVSDLSVSRITQHTVTNVKVAELLAGVRFDEVGEVGGPGRLRVTGLGLRREEVSSSPRG